ncbi:hypothetical protein [Streptomyces venezuelae]|uniref:Uncharacterized protein n=1 Tax=Streptomyces venezuelae TaxID=54571 RepID=A0A5P2BW09_STRVZ|nr:hypothetical protein [Streptomyces venezuelae]QES34644.1 hypothetical protein DEJ48_15655 [Streptomyces venezuelae]
MTASERDAYAQPRGNRLPAPSAAVDPTNLSMSDLLASCAAASAVSTPPSDTPAPAPSPAAERRRPPR